MSVVFSAANRGPRVQIKPVGRSKTKQSFRDESNIDIIMARYVKTGLIDHFAVHGGEYGFASSVSFHEAMNVVTKADQMFDALPAKARQKFHGDPGEFLDFVQNPENAEEMRELGLREPQSPVEIADAADAAEAASAPISPEDPPVEGEAPLAPDTVVT